MRHQAAAVIVGVQRPHGDVLGPAETKLARARVEIVEAVAPRPRTSRRRACGIPPRAGPSARSSGSTTSPSSDPRSAGRCSSAPSAGSRRASCISSMSLAASGSKVKAQNTTNFGFGTSFCASSMARSTCFCSSAACSGPKLTAIVSPVSATDPTAWICDRPGATSRSVIFSIAPPLARRPVRTSSSRHCVWREVSPDRATVASASAGAVCRPATGRSARARPRR
jgi:hypothetical protein